VVKAEVMDQIRGPKVYSFKKRRRKHSSKRLKGHRQSLTTVRITEIVAG
jgi:large subunit ribosomal protein L21